jgi:hypothetical protein
MKNRQFKLLKNEGNIDKSSTFIEIQTLGQKHPQQLSIENLLNLSKFPESHKSEKYNIEKDIDKNTIILDPSTLKIKVNTDILITPSVFSNNYTNQHIYYYQPPIDVSVLTGIHMVANENYLYIWVGNRWKRVILTEW